MKTMMALTLCLLLLLTPACSSAVPIRPAPPDTSGAEPDSTPGPNGEIQWKPRSHFREGAITGGIIGGVGGAGFFVFIGALVNALDEGGIDDITPLGYVGLGVFGAALGGSAGALVGGLIGSAFPNKALAPTAVAEPPGKADDTVEPPKHADTPPVDREELPAKKPAKRSFGSLTLQPLLLGEELGGGVQLTFLSHLTRALHAGFEGSLLFSETDIRSAGVVTRVYPAPSTGFYFVGDSGLYEYRFPGFIDIPTGQYYPVVDSITLFGGGLGAGMESRGDRLRFGVEARRRFSLQNIDEPRSYGFTQVGLTIRHLW